jgi:tRNA-splicing ligase RtcB
MKKVISTERIPIKLWLDDLEDSALEQAKNVANLPFACKQVILLPDSHYGFGCPVGTICATQGIVIPSVVGRDISCGILAIKFNKLAEEIDTATLKKIMGGIRKEVPMGLNQKHDDPLPEELMPEYRYLDDLPIVKREWINARKSLKSLGSGNHFFELQKDTEGYLWVMIHSGSRNLGSKVADHYDKIAKNLNERYFSKVDVKHDLAFLLMDTEEGQTYWKEMNYCMLFAEQNRLLMGQAACNVINDFISLPTSCGVRSIGISHNYAAYENHFGVNYIVHRKGAIRAKDGELGIVPGSQGSKSYITKGLGNAESFESSSHGAGRTMSRSKAKKQLNLADEIKILDDQGIIHGMRQNKDLDEAVSSYKDISIVMENQKDLTEIFMELSPIASMKGQ